MDIANDEETGEISPLVSAIAISVRQYRREEVYEEFKKGNAEWISTLIETIFWELNLALEKGPTTAFETRVRHLQPPPNAIGHAKFASIIIRLQRDIHDVEIPKLFSDNELKAFKSWTVSIDYEDLSSPRAIINYEYNIFSLWGCLKSILTFT